MRVPSSMPAAHNFARSPQATIPRSSFNRSHGVKTTFDAGLLIPIYLDEALPGDTFNCKLTAFARLATPIYPIMDNLYMDTFFFAVPNRLLWDNWERFNGAQDNPDDTTDYILPYMVAPPGSPQPAGFPQGSLYDYFGYPTKIPNLLIENALFSRAYNKIYNDWFRDENLQDSAVVDLDNGPDSWADYFLRYRGKRHDYFTSCLPWPQKGPAVELPLGLTAPIISTGDQITFRPSTTSPNTDRAVYFATGTNDIEASAPFVAGNEAASFGSVTGLITDLSSATAATINQLRQAFQIQRLYERDARGGTRYTEIIQSHFGVVSPDARLQRAEYLGGGSSPININPVAQTSSTDATSPQGNLSAFGTATLINHGFTKSFTEHCVIIGFVSVRADYTYQQGLNRMFSRRYRWDFYWPALSHIGEQAVLNKEIFATETSTDFDVFGYQERYAEYRYKPSIVTGLFRSNATGTLDSWHLAQDFGALPTLGPEFIIENPPMARVKAVVDEPDFIFDGHFSLVCARPMPVYSVPGLIDHF